MDFQALTVGSLFSGAGGFDLAFEQAGCRVLWQVEIDRDANRVLSRHWPDVPRYPDVREVRCEMKTGDWYRKLSPQKAQMAIEMYDRGLSIGPIATYFGVSRQSMWDMLRRRTTMRPQLRYGADNHFYRGGVTANSRTHDILEHAIKVGAVTRPDQCDSCGTSGRLSDDRTTIQAHHPDYNKPLDVMWLCQPCHHEWHKNNRAIPAEGGDAKELAPVDVIVGGFP